MRCVSFVVINPKHLNMSAIATASPHWTSGPLHSTGVRFCVVSYHTVTAWLFCQVLSVRPRKSMDIADSFKLLISPSTIFGPGLLAVWKRGRADRAVHAALSRQGSQMLQQPTSTPTWGILLRLLWCCLVTLRVWSSQSKMHPIQRQFIPYYSSGA